MDITGRLAACRVLPVVTPHDVESTVELARALSRGGMHCIEITLRTESALDSMRAVKDALPDTLVAAGTVNTPAQLDAALQAGAELLVSPGISAELLDTAADRKAPFLPGVATASEVMLGLSRGFSLLKLFPAVPAGGVALLNSLAGPFPQVQFCPTGGLNPGNFREFLALPNVVCCGGSWMVSRALVEGQRWEEVERLVREALDVPAG